MNCTLVLNTRISIQLLFIVIILIIASCRSNTKQINKIKLLPSYSLNGVKYSLDTMPGPDTIIAIETVRKVKTLKRGKLKNNIYKSFKSIVATADTNSSRDSLNILPKKLKINMYSKSLNFPINKVYSSFGIVDNDHRDFIIYNKLNGLKHNFIYSVIMDHNNNLWLGTDGAGLIKYDGQSFTNYTKLDGLLSSNIFNIMESSTHQLYIASFAGGLNKFDGNSFVTFDLHSVLGEVTVSKLAEDTKGNLWLSTSDHGLLKFDGEFFYQYSKSNGLDDNITDISFDQNDNLFIGTRENGIYKYDGLHFIHILANQDYKLGYLNSIKCIKNTILIGSETKGLFAFQNGILYKYSLVNKYLLHSISVIVLDKDNLIWIGSKIEGVFRLSNDKFEHYLENKKSSTSQIEDIYINNQKKYFGTNGGGLLVYNDKAFSNYNIENGLIDNNFSGIVLLENNSLAFASTNAGIMIIDENSIYQLSTTEGLVENDINTLVQDKKGNIWVGTSNSGILKLNGNQIMQYKFSKEQIEYGIESIIEDEMGIIWVGTFGNGLYKFDGEHFIKYTIKQGLPGNTIRCLYADKFNNIWIGTIGGGLSKFNGRYFENFAEGDSRISNSIFSIIEDKDEVMWIGTYGNGLLRLKDQEFTIYSENEGLANNFVYDCLEDTKGNIWVGTRFGISLLTSEKKNIIDNRISQGYQESDVLFKNYSIQDGFTNVGVNPGKIFCEDKHGKIWVAATGGLTVIDPSLIDTESEKLSVHLNDVELFNEQVNWDLLNLNTQSSVIINGNKIGFVHFDCLMPESQIPDDLNMSYLNNYITFKFSASTLVQPEKVKYKYKLAGLDENWSALTSKSEASYSKINPGKYTFKVIGLNSTGNWSNELSYKFTISPPWWETWWAYSIYGLSFFGAMFTYIQYRSRNLVKSNSSLAEKIRILNENKIKEEENQALKKRALEVENLAMRAQMNPHFIFNSLNSINHFILVNDKLNASAYLLKFSQLIRMILENSGQPLITLEQELTALRLYIEMEALRFKQNFNFKIINSNDIDEEDIKVPPLIIQPFVENAIKHGLMHREGEASLIISTRHFNDALEIKVIDNGIGRVASEKLKGDLPLHRSMGIQLTKERILLTDTSGDFIPEVTINDLYDIDDHPSGTEVTIKLPLL